MNCNSVRRKTKEAIKRVQQLNILEDSIQTVICAMSQRLIDLSGPIIQQAGVEGDQGIVQIYDFRKIRTCGNISNKILEELSHK